MSKVKLKGRIYLDWIRNERGTIAIVPYSVKARRDAPVAMPVSWEKLKKLQSSDCFGMQAALNRLGELDPWAGIHALRQSIPKKILQN